MKSAALLSGLIVAAIAVSGFDVNKAHGQQSYDAGIAAYERRHFEAALLDLEPRAIAGDPNAQFYMYRIYSDSSYPGRDPQEADRWLQGAAKSNHPIAISRKQQEAQKRKDFEEVLDDCETIEYNQNEESEDEIESCLKRYKDLAEYDNYEAYSISAAYHLAELYNDIRTGIDISSRQLAEAIENDRNRDNLDLDKMQNLLRQYKRSEEMEEKALKYYNSAWKYHPGAQLRLVEFALEKEEYEKAFHHLLRIANRWPDQLSSYTDAGSRGDYLHDAREVVGHLFNGNKEISAFGKKLDGEKLRKLREKLHVSEDKVEAYVWYKLSQWDEAAINRELGDLAYEDANEAEQRLSDWDWKYQNGYGSGFYVGRNLIMTNWHVVSGGGLKVCDEIRVPFRKAELLVKDETADLAILRVQGEVNRGIAVRRPGDLEITEEVMAFGYPNPDKVSVRGNFTSGIVSGIRDPYLFASDDKERSGMIIHTAPISPGNSGGPLLDKYGRVVGVNTEVAPASVRVSEIIPFQNISYAMGYKRINSILFVATAELMKTGEYSPEEMLAMGEDALEAGIEYMETGGERYSLEILGMAEEDNSTENEPKSLKELYELAKDMTVRIECWRNH